MWQMKKYYLQWSRRGINILHEIRKRKTNWIGHILRRNCLLQQVTEGKIKEVIEVTERRGRRRRKLLDDLKKRRGYSHLKEEALDRTMWRARFGRDFGPVVRQTTKWMDISSFISSFIFTLWRDLLHLTCLSWLTSFYQPPHQSVLLHQSHFSELYLVTIYA
jgi:hypothetical protein